MSTNLPSLTCTVVRALYSALDECATLGNEECVLGKLHIIVEHPFPRIPSSVPPGNDSFSQSLTMKPLKPRILPHREVCISFPNPTMSLDPKAELCMHRYRGRTLDFQVVHPGMTLPSHPPLIVQHKTHARPPRYVHMYLPWLHIPKYAPR